MYEFDEIRETFRRGYKAEPGHYPATYRCPLGKSPSSDDDLEPYSHALYVAICKTLDTMPLIFRRYFVITTVERVALRWNPKKQQDEHILITDKQVYQRIAHSITGAHWRDVEHMMKNGGEKKMQAALVFGVKQYA
ncbi:hypothetical protein GCM10009007_03160 [Formosimonas limnophila]|uniref:Uncharacterized protein n=1 Tax=Formosimonas limnophila TaxID=1384487 RepID=A0A8J3FZU4_9BURK|nr:hypothetical protein [Formosimonas limnophila]GHA66084.1 hypothetical protein GCM10009007_03160 [Formosimonas limnophila]